VDQGLEKKKFPRMRMEDLRVPDPPLLKEAIALPLT
jgi:hypothetical protein